MRQDKTTIADLAREATLPVSDGLVRGLALVGVDAAGPHFLSYADADSTLICRPVTCSAFGSVIVRIP
jgi:hypothetical protein